MNVRKISVTSNGLYSTLEMLVKIPDNRDEEEYIDEFLDNIFNDNIRFDCEWNFMN